MFVDNSMTCKVITIDKEANIFEAQDLMAKNRIRHLPVVAKGDILIGIVTDRDVRSAMPFELLKNDSDPEERAKQREKIEALKIKDIMTVDPIKASPVDTIQDVILLIQRSNVGALPVVDERNRLKGIISVRDILRAFINVLGIGSPGALMGILVEEKIGQMKKIVDTITEENISFGSILVARYWDKDKRAVFPYLLTQNMGRIKRKLRDTGFELIDPLDWYLAELPNNDE